MVIEHVPERLRVWEELFVTPPVPVNVVVAEIVPSFVSLIVAPVTVNVAEVNIPLLVVLPLIVREGIEMGFAEPLMVWVAPLIVYNPLPAFSVPLTTRLRLMPTVRVLLVKIAPELTVRFATRVFALIVTVLVLVPLPMVTLGLVPDGVRDPKLAVPVKRMVPGPFTPFVVVPLLAKVPDTVSICPELIINLLEVALRARFLILPLPATVSVTPVQTEISSPAPGLQFDKAVAQLVREKIAEVAVPGVQVPDVRA